MRLYLDAAATTYPRHEVKESALAFPWYNPSSVYRPGVDARKETDRIRNLILTAIAGSGRGGAQGNFGSPAKFGVRPGFGAKAGSGAESGFGAEAGFEARTKELIFTSGGTESNNMAIVSAARKHHSSKCLVSGIDHSSVHEAAFSHFSQIEEIPVDRHGHLCLEDVDFKDSALVCITHVNNEIGTIADVEAVYSKIRALPPAQRPRLLVDGVQALGKIPLRDVRKAVQYSDFYSISAHKIHGLKGAGALIGNKADMLAFHIGGDQEGRLRGGTENTVGIAAFGKAVEILMQNWNEDMLISAHEAKSRLIRLMDERIDSSDYVLNSPEDSTPLILSVSFKSVKSEIVIHSLADKGILVSAASACSSTRNTISRVIQKIGTEKGYADGTIRISLAPESFYSEPERALCDADFVYFADELAAIVSEIQKYHRMR